MPKPTSVWDYFQPVEGTWSPRGSESFRDHPERRTVEGKGALEGLSTKHRMILSFEMQGMPQRDIAMRLGMHEATISNITRDPRYIKHREELLGAMDAEFFSMKPLALQALRTGLTDTDPNVALRAADMWFSGAKYQGYDRNAAPPANVTAEDVVKQLLQVNVQVNVEKG